MMEHGGMFFMTHRVVHHLVIVIFFSYCMHVVHIMHIMLLRVFFTAHFVVSMTHQFWNSWSAPVAHFYMLVWKTSSVSWKSGGTFNQRLWIIHELVSVVPALWRFVGHKSVRNCVHQVHIAHFIVAVRSVSNHVILVVVKCADGSNRVPLVNCDRSSDSSEKSLRPLRVSFSDKSPVFAVWSAKIRAHDATFIVRMGAKCENFDRISSEFTADMHICSLPRRELKGRTSKKVDSNGFLGWLRSEFKLNAC